MRPIFLVACLIALTACTGGRNIAAAAVDPEATPTRTPFGPAMDESSTIVFSTAPAPAFRPSGTPYSAKTSSSPELPHYTLVASLDYSGHRVEVDETIQYPNSTGFSLPEIVAAVEPNLWAGCFVLDEMEVDGRLRKDYSLRGGRLEVPLDTPLLPGSSLNVTFHFKLNLPPADPYHVFGYNNLQVNLVDWYPFIVPYSNGWLLHPPGEVGEHLVYDEAAFDVTVTPSGSSDQLIVAASAPGEEGAGSWHYSLANARTFAISASPEYQTASGSAEGALITSYFFAAEKTEGMTVLHEAAKAVRTFSSLFANYPYPSLSIVESPFYDGMEYDGLIFLSRHFYTQYNGTPLNYLIDIAVHETAHQWWFGSVGNDQALEPWLDEALATYSEFLFYEKNYPDVTGWWNFRVESYTPSGWVDTDIYHGVDFRRYANAVYLQGAKFLEALRQRMGNESFFGFLKDYASQMTGKRASASDFFRIMKDHTQKDVSDIIASYFQMQP